MDPQSLPQSLPLSAQTSRISTTKRPSQTSTKHGFYKEFSIINNNPNKSFRKNTDQFLSHAIKKVKPSHDETYYSASYLSRFFNRECALTFVPLFQWLPYYQTAWLKRDVMAGLTVAILLVPQSLAYATLAGLPPEWGLYASVMPVFFYVLWSTSNSVAVGPVAPTAIMVASAVEGVMTNMGYTAGSAGYDELYQSIAMTLSFVCGLILILFGLIRAGFIIVFLSRPVMTGFIMSAAFIILINQFRGLLGLEMDRFPLFYQTLMAVFDNLHTIHWQTAIISAVSLVVLFLPKCCLRGKIPKWVPIPLIIIVFWILVSVLADLEAAGVAIVGGGIKSGFATPKLPNFEYIGDVLPSSIIVAIVSYMGSIALSKGFEQKTNEIYKQQSRQYREWHAAAQEKEEMKDVELRVKEKEADCESSNTLSFSIQCDESTYEQTDSDKSEDDKAPMKPLDLPPLDVSPNMEFVAYGVANLFGSFFSSQVISASFSRSALNFEMNGHTQISSVIQAVICLLCLLFLMPLLSPLPKCVLASLVAVSVYRLIKNGVHEFIFLYRVSRIELIEFLISFIAPLLIGLEIGIFLSIGTSILVNLLRHSFTSIIDLGRLQSAMSDDTEYVDCALFKRAKKVQHVTIIEMKAELSFANNNRLVDKIRALLAGGHKYIVVSLNLTSFIDTTAIRQIATIFEDAKGAFICLSQSRPKVIELINRFERDTDEFPDNIKTFVSTHDAVLYLLSMRAKTLHTSEAFGSDSETLSCLDYNFDEAGDTNGVTPIHAGHSFAARSKMQSTTMSELELAIHQARIQTFAIPKSDDVHTAAHPDAHGPHDVLIAIDSDMEEEEEEEKEVACTYLRHAAESNEYDREYELEQVEMDLALDKIVEESATHQPYVLYPLLCGSMMCGLIFICLLMVVSFYTDLYISCFLLVCALFFNFFF